MNRLSALHTEDACLLNLSAINEFVRILRILIEVCWTLIWKVFAQKDI